MLQNEAVLHSLIHHPNEWHFSEQIILVATANVSMSPYKPTLLDMVKLSGWWTLPLLGRT